MFKKIGTFKDSIDGTIKCVYESDKKIIEISLLFNKDDRNVVCLPTHHFCSLGCRMCHLTNNCLNKKMEPIKYDDLIYCLLDCLKYFSNKDNLLISFMGVGEPLLNLELIKNIYLNEELIKEKYKYKNICYAVSTMMPNNNIIKLKELVSTYKIPLKLHFSLHSPIDSKRLFLIPSTKVNVEDAFKLLTSYKEDILNDDEIMQKYRLIHKCNEPVEIHYTLISNVNDSTEELEKLVKLEQTYRIQIKFIRFNPINDLKISDKENIWIKELKNIDGLIVKLYFPPGREVGSSCGEFTKHYYHEEIETKKEKEEFLIWKKEHEINI